MAEREFGVVTGWGARGFGFIRPEGAESDLFVHQCGLRGSTFEAPIALAVGMRVSFVRRLRYSGRPMAVDVVRE